VKPVRAAGGPELSGTSLATFRRQLLRWYGVHQRKLPWRGINDPYRTWVSEIMLQQTRVAAVLEHYDRFLRRFPTVERLARAPESAVLAAWSGLGYYRRARMLHAAARQVVREHRGVFPTSAEAWRELPGIGRYTAAAIASIAFGEPVAVVDGNVERVLRRIFAWDGKPVGAMWAAAERLLSPDRPGDFNQAMMELGATICLPADPLCAKCPVARWCQTKGGGKAGLAEKRRKREVACALALRNGHVRLRRRAATETVMPGMWELPAAKPNGESPAAVLRHSITTTDYRVHVIRTSPRDGQWVPVARMSRLPLTGLTRKILKHFHIIQ